MNARILLWSLTVVLVLIPTALIIRAPDTYDDPIVSFLLSVFLTAVSIAASRVEFMARAKEKTQTEWLSQAESACDRLLTTCAQITRVRQRMLCTCTDASSTLPELQDKKLTAVRILLERNCQNAATHLQDAAEHLESAVEDWKRFIAKTCEGDDCQRIGLALDRRKVHLWKEMVDAKGPLSECSPSDGQPVPIPL